MRTENNPASEAKATNPDQSRPDVMKGEKRVFKVGMGWKTKLCVAGAAQIERVLGELLAEVRMVKTLGEAGTAKLLAGKSYYERPCIRVCDIAFLDRLSDLGAE